METKPVNMAIALVVVVVVGFAAWQFGYQSGWNKAKERVAKAGFLPPSGEMRAVSGTLQAVSGSTLTVTTNTIDPFASDELKTRQVTVDQKTKIEKLTQKDPAAFEKESAAFTESLKKQGGAAAGGKPLSPPEPFIRETIKLSDIKTGDHITVLAGENIATAKQFTALTVSVLPTFAPPPSAPAR